jgi:hypothetical protein
VTELLDMLAVSDQLGSAASSETFLSVLGVLGLFTIHGGQLSYWDPSHSVGGFGTETRVSDSRPKLLRFQYARYGHLPLNTK